MFLIQQIIKLQLQRGQGLMEYGLILILVAIVIVVVTALLGPAIGNMFSTVMDTL